MNKVLGLDLSTTICGYCISEEKKIIVAGYIDISKCGTHKEKACKIIDVIVKHEFDIIQVEAPLLNFKFGRTSAHTIVKLIENKAVVCYILSEQFNKPITYINVSTARKQLFGKARIKGVKPKDFVRMNLDGMYDMTSYITLNRNNNEDAEVGDIRDAIVMSLYRD